MCLPAPLKSCMARKDDDEKIEMELHLHIKEQMKAERELRGWTQADTAGYLGTTRANYEKYEGVPKRGKPRKVPTFILIRFIKLINADYAAFIAGARKRG